MSRSWCPAMAADEAVSFDKLHLGNVSSGSPLRKSENARALGAQAAHVAAESIALVVDAASKVMSSPPSKFSSKVAVSVDPTAVHSGSGDGEAMHAAPPFVLRATVPDEECALKPLPPRAVFRSLQHIKKSGCDESVKGYDFSHVDASSDELRECLTATPVKDAVSIQVRHSIRGTLGIPKVLEALLTNEHLRALDVGSNPAAFAVGEEPNSVAAESLVKFLMTNSNLHTLGLSSTGVGAAAATVLPALRSHGGITSLDLSRNGLGLQTDEAALAAFVQLVQENKFLLQLDISSNDIGPSLAKQLLQGLQLSDTRVKTPEAEPEPEAEEYTDEIPPEEEAPQVTVGFPEDAKAPEPEGGLAETGGDSQPPPDAGVAPSPDIPGDVDTTQEPQDDDANAAEGTASEAVPEAASPGVDDDPETAEAARLEAQEKAQEDRRRREEEWSARMKQYIWEPEQILFVYSESTKRRAATVEYVNATLDLKKLEKAERKEAKKRQLHRERTERDRRSGWSHLQCLDLSGNPIGNVGAKALALAIRHEVPMSAEEVQAKEEERAVLLQAARDAAREARRRERRAAADAAARAVEPPRIDAVDEPAPPVEADIPDAEINPEDAVVEDEPMPASPTDDNEPADAAAALDVAAKDEDAGAEDVGADGEDIDVSDVTVPGVKSTKPGLRTVRALKLDHCRIGTAGLKHLVRSVASECPSLEVLSLRKNKFGTKKKSVRASGEAKDNGDKTEGDDDAEDTVTVKVEVPTWVSPSVCALSLALSTAPALRVLDLSWNRMYPNSIRTLAAGVRSCPTLTWLGLDGNVVGFSGGDEVSQLSAFAVLLEAIGTQGKVDTLNVASCELEHCFSETEATLLSTIPQLTSLNMSNNHVTNRQLEGWGHVFMDLADDAPRTSLVRLSLGGNASVSGSDGGGAIATIITKSPDLQFFSASNCPRLGDAGIERVEAALSRTVGLRFVSLHRCGITRNLDMLATALAQLPNLRHVDVGDNEAPVGEFLTFLRVLRESEQPRSVASLSMWSRTGESEDLLESLTELAKEKQSLTYGDVGIPLVFNRQDPAVDGDEPVEDEFEAFEVACAKNRLLALKAM